MKLQVNKLGKRSALILLACTALPLPAADPPSSIDPFTHLAPIPRPSFGRLDRYTFDNSGKWDPSYLTQAKEGAALLESWGIKISRPPANSSLRTAREIEHLLAKRSKRSEPRLANATKQKELSGFVFGDYRYKAGKRPATDALLQHASNKAAPIIFALKKKYDRARPSVLDKDIKPALENPPHPAYPSGHASQAYLFAHILSELDPPRSDTALKAARAIAQNRELVGVHYPSDSEAGRLLAPQLVKALRKDPEFTKLFEAARKEF